MVEWQQAGRLGDPLGGHPGGRLGGGLRGRLEGQVGWQVPVGLSDLSRSSIDGMNSSVGQIWVSLSSDFYFDQFLTMTQTDGGLN